MIIFNLFELFKLVLVLFQMKIIILINHLFWILIWIVDRLKSFFIIFLINLAVSTYVRICRVFSSMIECISCTRCILLLIIITLFFLKTLVGLAYKLLIIHNFSLVDHACIIINLIIILYLFCYRRPILCLQLLRKFWIVWESRA